MKARGWSYGAIAMDINFDCLVHVCRAAEEIVALDAPVISSDGFSNAALLMRVMRIKDEDILAWLLPAIKEVKQGHAPWPLNGGPITAQRVRDTLRQWDNERSTQVVVVKTPPEHRVVPTQTIATVNGNHTERAKALLNRSYPESLAKFERTTRQHMHLPNPGPPTASTSAQQGSENPG
jgi:hypothetical protein